MSTESFKLESKAWARGRACAYMYRYLQVPAYLVPVLVHLLYRGCIQKNQQGPSSQTNNPTRSQLLRPLSTAQSRPTSAAELARIGGAISFLFALVSTNKFEARSVRCFAFLPISRRLRLLLIRGLHFFGHSSVLSHAPRPTPNAPRHSPLLLHAKRGNSRPNPRLAISIATYRYRCNAIHAAPARNTSVRFDSIRFDSRWVCSALRLFGSSALPLISILR